MSTAKMLNDMTMEAVSNQQQPTNTPQLAGTLSIDLGAIVGNWRALDAMTAPSCVSSAVVKADAYGCGIVQVGQALAKAGCQMFFAAMPEEGVRLRTALPDATIHILSGYAPGDEATFRAHDLRPVLNAPEQFADWFNGPAGPAMVQLDTGMNRLGLEADELQALGPLPDQVTHVISHLACADEPEHPQNTSQITAFAEMTDGLGVPRSLSATAGILLGPVAHHDLTRPGIGLYGGAPFDAAQPVVSVEVPILQIRDVAPGESAGYGAAWVAERPSRLATISAGYADGVIRALSIGGASGFLAGQPVPLAGRVSMDLITLDVTDAPDARPGMAIELLGPNQTIDTLASKAGTIGHEILTSLGNRYTRIYR